MFEFHNFPLFIASSILLNVIPGPDAIYIISISIAQGRTAGLLSSWGICTGAFIHTIAAGLGLSAILSTSAYAFTIVKYVSAIYLIGLGIKSFLDQKDSLNFNNTDEIESTQRKYSSNWNIFGQGVLVDLLNPKVAIFFLAFLPQFIVPSSESKIATFIFLGTIVVLISLIWELILVLFSSLITHYLQQNDSRFEKLNYLTGFIFIGLGIIIGIEKL